MSFKRNILTVSLAFVFTAAVSSAVFADTTDDAEQLKKEISSVQSEEASVQSDIDLIESQKEFILGDELYSAAAEEGTISSFTDTAKSSGRISVYNKLTAEQDALKEDLEELQLKEQSLQAELDEIERPIRLGEEIIEFASQFEGCPYVYGGNSLSCGTDCSGFVCLVYASFGYDLPRTSWGLAECGTEVSFEEARAGDILCYSGHVALYMGNGKLIHAKTESVGIAITDDPFYAPLLTIRRIIR